MTCRYTNTDWLDVLYNCVRKTSGGVVDAARFLTDRRGKSIHPESLRSKLKRSEGDAISVEMAGLLSEWMEEKAGGAEYAHDWFLAFAAEHGLAVDAVPPAPPGGWKCELSALQAKAMQIGALSGSVLGVAADSVADGEIDQAEADHMIEALRDLRTMGHRMERNILRAVRKQGEGQ
ncbi:hypothetical protein [Bordetella genomosp. 4]|uniref:Uncharacterized protein n=1 Tax=Bordetella genomosp. 4 TaxID=463044 RepID=A0A261U7N9_9BORD|nr:hypothetical protein [Bordetella genomosp. 4]OZI57645.1 hypothetical protein CAL20_09725 [Bordetella genomosp. 4]